jgi:hypothetical protein
VINTWLRLCRLSTLLVVLLGGLLVGGRPVGAAAPDRITARLGISAGAAIEQAPLGLHGRPLKERIPILFQTADQLDVRIETVSVGQGFFSDGGVLLSEKDLDLVVTGRRDRITTMAAVLGKAFDQSLVFVWFFVSDPADPQLTATIPLPRGADALTPEIYQQLVTELADGGHVRYAGIESLLFVANTGGEPEPAFVARMGRARTLLANAGIVTRPTTCDHAEFLALDRDSYDGVIAGRLVRPVMSAAAGGSVRHGRPNRQCAA